MRKPKPETLYVYKEYSDFLAYGEEIIMLFRTRKDAEIMLRHRVETYFEQPFEIVAETYDDDEWSDTVRKDYVSIAKDQKGCRFWIVEAHNVETSSADAIVRMEFDG